MRKIRGNDPSTVLFHPLEAYQAEKSQELLLPLFTDKNIRKKDNKGWTALMYAARNKDPEAVKIFIEL